MHISDLTLRMIPLHISWGWLDDAKKNGKGLGKENLDRVMNNARWLINEVSNKL